MRKKLTKTAANGGIGNTVANMMAVNYTARRHPAVRAATNVRGGGWRKNMERAKGIEPSFSAWEADVLPLNYARGV